ncbi:MAG: thioredoxin family protein [Bacteroidota bacterium]
MRFSLLALALFLVACQPQADEAPDASAEVAEAVSAEATPGDIQPGVMAPDFKLASTSGEPYLLGDLRGKTVVLEWLNYDCPYVAKHYNSGNMQALQQGYTSADYGSDVVWLSIVSSAPGEQGHFEPAEMDARTEQEGGLQTAVLMDPTGEVGRLYGAKTTPHMFVISPEGTVVYNGAIDDKPVTNPESLDGATNYLVSAMDALAEGREADPDRTVPYGCSVKYANAEA